MMKRYLRIRCAIGFVVTAICLIGVPMPNLILARPPYSSSYFMVTDEEQRRDGDYLFYYTGDTLPRRMRTNHNFQFFITSRNLWHDFNDSFFVGGVALGDNPPFPHVPRLIEHARQIEFPIMASELRDSATSHGRWLSSYRKQYVYGLTIDGQVGSIWRWHTGTPSPMGDRTQVIGMLNWDTSRTFGIFCDGELWVKGIARGKLGIGAAGNIRIMGDLRCEDATMSSNWLVPATSPNSITVISEACEMSNSTGSAVPWQGVIIANTWENGRENGSQFGWEHPERNDVVITAQIVALNGNFTFEDQNDSTDAYQSITQSDERGHLYFHGSVMQNRAGYLHRSTHGGTGYDVKWVYDTRFLTQRAPFSIPIVER